MKPCNQCKKTFPDELINELVASVGEDGRLLRFPMCPICALAVRNKFHHLPPDTPFSGPIARGMYEQAVKHLKETKQ